ncbi:hypothetical protein SAMN05216302_100541 [Nitrosomonas aestuarii]|uniref:Uncharacterized protein n=1 Tax=Nitrosomonas aestuarii TaxID=52441 RepID=A0A1I3Z1H3_9PROT|nr:hypothetical protein [Nitrosomonas aestuarii]SFK37948.1 hypothetical protein SAMN05216302_100541 [Nitrosomonas aestuarii]
MALDKIHTLQTGVSLEISTVTLQELITKILTGRELPELGQIHCANDLYEYLSVIVYKGAADLIKRRQQWVSQKNKADLVAARPIPFREFCNFFWRNLDEHDPDGDEWVRLIADDSFFTQLSEFLNKIRTAERKVHQEKDLMIDLNLGSV